jgi:aspartate/tyrosine/aromatic aminotransferase
MAGRISRMRLSLRGHLARETQGSESRVCGMCVARSSSCLVCASCHARAVGCDWSHLTQQVGMFGFLGLDERCVDALRKAHIYMPRDGRISLCGVNDSNVAYLARKIAQARRGAHA